VLRIAARLGFGDRGSGTAPRFVRELAGSGVRREAATGPAPVAVESDGPGASGRIAPGPSPRDPAEPTSRGDRIDGMVRSRGPNLHHSVEERPLAARPNDRITAVDSVSARALEHPSWMQPEPPPDPERSAPATVRGPQEDPGRPAGALAPAASRSR
jgi:hypothetical protein